MPSNLLRRALLLCSLLLTLATGSRAEEPDLGQLLNNYEFTDVRISPDGKFVAATHAIRQVLRMEEAKENPTKRGIARWYKLRLLIANLETGEAFHLETFSKGRKTDQPEEYLKDWRWSPRSTLVVLTEKSWLEYDPSSRSQLLHHPVVTSTRDKLSSTLQFDPSKPLLTVSTTSFAYQSASFWQYLPAQRQLKRLESSRPVYRTIGSALPPFGEGRGLVIEPDGSDVPFHLFYIEENSQLTRKSFHLPHHVALGQFFEPTSPDHLLVYSELVEKQYAYQLFDWRREQLLPGIVKADLAQPTINVFLAESSTRSHLESSADSVNLSELLTPEQTAATQEIAAALPGQTLILRQASDAPDRFLVAATSPSQPTTYLIYKRSNRQFTRLFAELPIAKKLALSPGTLLPIDGPIGDSGRNRALLLPSPSPTPQTPLVYTLAWDNQIPTYPGFNQLETYLSQRGLHVVRLNIPDALVAQAYALDTPATIAAWQSTATLALQTAIASIEQQLPADLANSPRHLLALGPAAPFAAFAPPPVGHAWQRIAFASPALPSGSPNPSHSLIQLLKVVPNAEEPDPTIWAEALRARFNQDAIPATFVSLWKRNTINYDNKRLHAETLAKALNHPKRERRERILPWHHSVVFNQSILDLLEATDIADFLLSLPLRDPAPAKHQ